MSTHRRLVASILVIGLLAVALTFVCSEGVHFLTNMGSDCATMSHSDGVTAIVSATSSRTLISGMLAVLVAFAVFFFWFDVPMRLVPVSAAPGLPPDPLYGRLRL